MINNKTKIIFFGADIFGADIFGKLISNKDLEITALVTRSPKPAGRGLKPLCNPLLQIAKEHQIETIYAETANSWDKIIDFLKFNDVNLAVVVGFGKIIPIKKFQKVGLLDKFINIHPSLLPQYRGPSPIETAILNGDSESGVTFIQLTETMDAGPILWQQKVDIKNKNAHRVGLQLSKLAARSIAAFIRDYQAGFITPKPQKDHQATYSHIVTKDDGLIKSNDAAEKIYAKFQALSPWPGIFMKIENKTYKIIEGCIKNDLFVINKIQPENRKIMDGNSFANGYKSILTHFPEHVKINLIQKGKN